MSRMRIATLSTTVLAAFAVGVGAPAVTSAHDSAEQSRPFNHCQRSFAGAVEDYRQTTFDKDADGFNDLLHDDVSAIFADGSTLLGKEATAGFIESFFADEEWTQTLDVVHTEVEGCRSGFVLFDSVYTPSPSSEGVPLAIGVTFTFERGEWLVLHNQDSDGPVS
ncbi:nuclear transport factor 2 family protein [Nocardioides bizhenqiangii]|uniref:Nuclear transport factor 2 family protein n=1 Tax=Nocardioides bizhenqiangii TaxID=3095076 RepID=A0ABZ0ZQB2_9ACTN|nr:nuclear transport factor 2 family protein [Nocardioides sp. HM61]WQQ26546.1 nuclear transport factor 2 family protein [Nocardioides sp. HM61]